MNIPMMKMEKFVKAFIPDKYEDKYKGVIRAFSIILSLLLLVLIIVVIAFLLIPELVENIESLMNNIPAFIEGVKDWVINLLDKSYSNSLINVLLIGFDIYTLVSLSQLSYSYKYLLSLLIFLPILCVFKFPVYIFSLVTSYSLFSKAVYPSLLYNPTDVILL